MFTIATQSRNSFFLPLSTSHLHCSGVPFLNDQDIHFPSALVCPLSIINSSSMTSGLHQSDNVWRCSCGVRTSRMAAPPLGMYTNTHAITHNVHICLTVSSLRAYWLRLPHKDQIWTGGVGAAVQNRTLPFCVSVSLSGREYNFLIRLCRGHADVNMTWILMCCGPGYLWRIL